MHDFSPPSHPAEIFLDTDMATDCDDAGAMAVLHALADAGEARIRAVVVNNKDAASAGAVAALNAFYGRAGIPLGMSGGGDIGAPAGAFVQALAGDTARYGHTPRRDAPSAVDIYRRTLAAVADGRAVIASIGHLNNLHALLLSPPDAHSPLAGGELVRRKVAHLVVMGGDYPEGKEHNFFARGSHAVTAEAINRWPTPILFSGFTLGLAVRTGPGLLALPETHPVRRAYALHPSRPLENGRPSWDQTAVLAAVRGPACFWELSPAGVNHIAADGSNQWQSDPLGSHAYLIEKKPPAEAAAEIEALMLGRTGTPANA
ncbi:MAG TPA: hypothetical protein VIS74_04090 [Chthoniobacterales bacterium]